MNYDEMIAKALKGRSVNSMAKAWGLQQKTLDRYVKGESMPDYNTGLRIAKEAGIEPGEAFEALAQAERIHKARNFKLQMGHTRAELIAAIALVAVVVNLFLTPRIAEAAPAMAVQQANSLAIDYAKNGSLQPVAFP